MQESSGQVTGKGMIENSFAINEDNGRHTNDSVMTTSEANNGLQVEKTRSATMHKSTKLAKVESEDMAGELKIHRSASMSDKRVRLDRNGNPITTVIGAFSVETRRLLIKQKKLATLR